MSTKAGAPAPPSDRGLQLRHLRWGWCTLLAYLLTGLVLEAMHGFKVRWYFDVDNETRRLMWTLAHAHGTFLSIVHLVFARAGVDLRGWTPGRRGLASSLLATASLLLPLGFLLAGLHVHRGDPGLGIMLVPVGALAFIIAALLTGISARA